MILKDIILKIILIQPWVTAKWVSNFKFCQYYNLVVSVRGLNWLLKFSSCEKKKNVISNLAFSLGRYMIKEIVGLNKGVPIVKWSFFLSKHRWDNPNPSISAWLESQYSIFNRTRISLISTAMVFRYVVYRPSITKAHLIMDRGFHSQPVWTHAIGISRPFQRPTSILLLYNISEGF